MNEKKTCEDCKYYLNDYWNCQGEDKPCHEFIENDENKKMSKKYLYKDINGDLFIFNGKHNGKCYIENADTGNKCWCKEVKFDALFTETQIKISKYRSGVIIDD